MSGNRIDFDWDPAKARQNSSKHGIAFEEAMTVFADGLALTLFDEHHSNEEERWVTMGMSSTGRLIVVIHTHDEMSEGRTFVRIISARSPTKREMLQYSEG